MNFDLKGKKVLIIAPHPDDEILGFGGLIHRCKKEGAQVKVLYMAVGSCRQLVTGSTHENIRLEEAKNVSKHCGFEYEFLFIGEQFLRLDQVAQKDLIDPIEDLIEAFKPDILGISMHNSYDQDHRAVYEACITACRPVPRHLRHMPSLIVECEEPCSWVNDGQSFSPTLYLELDEEGVQGKIEAMKLHATQHREDPHPRSGENLRRWLEIRGKEIGVHAAEAYRVKRMLC